MRIWLFLRGVAMGLAEVVPGVSGGTIAFVTGIYDEFIVSLSRIDLRCFGVLRHQGISGLWRHINGNFLLTLALGMLLGILIFARVMNYALLHFEPPVWSFFFGLILLSVVLIGKDLPARVLLWLAPVGLLLGYGAASLPVDIATGPAGAAEPVNTLWILLGGAVAVSAWLLPAISGSFMLVLLGLYKPVIQAVSEWNWTVLLALAAGCVLGLLLFTKALRWAMTHLREPLLAFLTGFMAGALPRLWPWQAQGQRLMPDTYVTLTGQSSLEGWVVLSAICGTLLLWLLARHRP